MAKRMEQSRRHGPHDPRSSRRVHLVDVSALSTDAYESTSDTPPTLTLVGGTDFAAAPPLHSHAVVRA